MFGQHAGETVPIQVDPLVAAAVEPGRQVLQALGSDVVDGELRGERNFGVLEFERRQRPLEVAIPLADVTVLRGRCHERGNRLSALRVAPIGEIQRPHQAIAADVFLPGKMMKHEDALAQAVRAHLEAGTVGGERVEATEPLAHIVAGKRLVRVVLSVIQHDLEHPVGIRYLRQRSAARCGSRT